MTMKYKLEINKLSSAKKKYIYSKIIFLDIFSELEKIFQRHTSQQCIPKNYGKPYF